MKPSNYLKNIHKEFSVHFARRKEGFLVLSTNPVNDVDIDYYKSNLEQAFGNDANKSIALFGADGSGKNSVIETYKKTCNLRFLHLKHAHGNCGIAAIEGEIINQLIHNIDPKKIPKTRFPIKEQQNRCDLGIAFLAIALFICVLHVVYFSDWQIYVKSIQEDWLSCAMPFLKFSASHGARILSGAIGVIILTIALYAFIKNLRYGSVKKVNLKGTEIELFVDSNAPYFDHYLDDVVYLFENTDTDVIVFEDIDLCFTKQIFARLQNINSIVNKKGKILRFLYLLPNDCLTPSEKGKLFNYTFSVAGYNVYERFGYLLHKSRISTLMPIEDNRELFEKIAYGVHDTRLLVDICNRFTAHNSANKKQGLSYQKLMAMVVFIIYFEDEYHRLINKTGFVHFLIENKNSLIALCIDSKIEALQKRIELTKAEPLQSKEELNIVYEYRVRKLQCENPSSDLEEEISRLQIEKATRCQLIDEKSAKAVTEWEKEIRCLQRQKRKYIPKGSLREILTDKNTSEIFSAVMEITGYGIGVADHPQIELLMYFAKEGYIDESYKDYFFIGNSNPTNQTFRRRKK